jgi:flagellar secretion chaperone FliS
MSYSNANVYREREILTASPEKLVVMVCDHVLVSLRRARVAMDAGNVTERIRALGRAREGVMELIVSTDVERGGDMANKLRALYAFALRELVTIGRSPDVKRLDKIAGVVGNVREAFATVAGDPTVARSPAA